MFLLSVATLTALLTAICAAQVPPPQSKSSEFDISPQLTIQTLRTRSNDSIITIVIYDDDITMIVMIIKPEGPAR